MFHLTVDPSLPKPQLYAATVREARALVEGERDLIANAANLASLLYHSLPEVNWAGFYLMREGELVVGPFQGKPACTRIAIGRGVCGTAAEQRRTVVVPNVHQFPGHIACDAASSAEIVVPIVAGGRLLGVLDLDSPIVGRFDEQDQAGLDAIVQVLIEHSALPAS